MSDPDEDFDHERCVRCPRCGHTWDYLEDPPGDDFVDGNDIEVWCHSCDFKFVVAVMVSYQLTSGPMLPKGASMSNKRLNDMQLDLIRRLTDKGVAAPPETTRRLLDHIDSLAGARYVLTGQSESLDNDSVMRPNPGLDVWLFDSPRAAMAFVERRKGTAHVWAKHDSHGLCWTCRIEDSYSAAIFIIHEVP